MDDKTTKVMDDKTTKVMNDKTTKVMDDKTTEGNTQENESLNTALRPTSHLVKYAILVFTLTIGQIM